MPSRPKTVPEPPAIQLDPLETARIAGLHYVSDDEPGIRRKRAGQKFSYFGIDGQKITDRAEIERINKLVIPPAYKDVWVCPDPNGHIQATGLDERGRKQYRYHPRWREVRDQTKFARTLEFARALPKIREQTERDLKRPGFPRERVLAMLVQLLEKTAIRIGNAEYARTNQSYGLTTMKNEHADVEGGQVHFHFKGKSGKWHQIDLKDRKLAAVIKKMGDLPGQSLFQYLDDAGETHNIKSSDVNDYIREIAGEEFTAKDFRTWAGTVSASLALAEFEKFEDERGAQANIVAAVKHVAQRLGNTPAVCRKSYIHPAILESYLDGSMLLSLKQEVEETPEDDRASLSREEAAVLGLLQQRLAQKVA